MAEYVKDFLLGMPLGLYIILVIAIGLLIASFVLPPAGAIAPSALQGAALILGGGWLLYVTANIPRFIESGAKIKASYGNAHIEIGRKNEKEEVLPPQEQYPEEEE